MHLSGPRPGTIIGDVYRVLRTIGEGAMGVVVLAHDEVLQRDVAIKIIRPELLESEDSRVRFLAEARAMARVNHPNVLQVHNFGEVEGAPYIVMELVDGDTVEAWLHSFPRGEMPDVDVALRILDETCQAVTAMHAANTVHRDLKPSNLLLDRKLRVRVADLGLAHVLRAVPGNARKDIVGTPAYMAPEIVLQREVPSALQPRADVYSLGCIAYELLTGRPPFEAPSTLAVMVKHTTEAVTPPTLVRPDLAPEYDAALLRALAKDPAERTPSADAFRRDLLAAHDRTSEPVRILVAEDDSDFRDALELVLAREFPYAVVDCVGDGRAALDAFDQRKHSVVILDLRMPKIDGIELTGLLRARETATATPIIVLTASGGPPEWKRLSAMGADGFLVKPVDLRDVVTLVRRALSDRSRSSPPSHPPPPPSRMP